MQGVSVGAALLRRFRTVGSMGRRGRGSGIVARVRVTHGASPGLHLPGGWPPGPPETETNYYT